MGGCIVKVSSPDEYHTFNNLYQRYSGKKCSFGWSDSLQRWETGFEFSNPLNAKLFQDKVQCLPGVRIISFDVVRDLSPLGKPKEQNSQDQDT